MKIRDYAFYGIFIIAFVVLFLVNGSLKKRLSY